jgi:copper chaperone
MVQKKLVIAGMSCNHCVMAVKRELARIPSVEIKEVQIGSASVVYDGAKITDEMIEAAIAEAGFSVVR